MDSTVSVMISSMVLRSLQLAVRRLVQGVVLQFVVAAPRLPFIPCKWYNHPCSVRKSLYIIEIRIIFKGIAALTSFL